MAEPVIQDDFLAALSAALKTFGILDKPIVLSDDKTYLTIGTVRVEVVQGLYRTVPHYEISILDDGATLWAAMVEVTYPLATAAAVIDVLLATGAQPDQDKAPAEPTIHNDPAQLLLPFGAP